MRYVTEGGMGKCEKLTSENVLDALVVGVAGKPGQLVEVHLRVNAR